MKQLLKLFAATLHGPVMLGCAGGNVAADDLMGFQKHTESRYPPEETFRGVYLTEIRFNP